MKVLWFSLSPCGSAVIKSKTHLVQGWMISLENEVKKNKKIQLAVCYQEWNDLSRDPFEYEGVMYYPLVMASRKLSDKWTTLFGSMEKKDNAVLQKMQAVLSDYKPDIIHVHGTEAAFVLVNEISNGIPVVFSIQGYKGPISLKYWSGLPESFVTQYDSYISRILRKSSQWTFKRFVYSAQRESIQLKKTKNIIGRTEWDKKISNLIAPQAKYYHLDEIMREPFYKTSWEKSNFSKKLTLVTTISSGVFKGLETLLETACILKDNVSFEYEWILIGCSKDDLYVKQCEKYCGIKSEIVNIKPAGKKDAKEIADILASADIYVQVSHIENSPNALCEAMLVGVPCIATYAGGTNTIIRDDESGILCQDGDAYGIAASIQQLQKDFDRAKVMAVKAKAIAHQRHNAVKIGCDLYDIYKKILTDK